VEEWEGTNGLNFSVLGRVRQLVYKKRMSPKVLAPNEP